MDGSVEVLQRVAASTVTVSAEVGPTHPSVSVLGTQRAGTGCVVDVEGHVLTVGYVVLGAERLTVTDIQDNEYSAQVAAQDFGSGLAVLTIDEGSVMPVRRGDSSMIDVGVDVFSVASVGGSERRAASGFVASTEPFDAYWEYSLERALWVSCTNPGLGGAPICDVRGRMVGIASLNLGTIGRSTLGIPSELYYDHCDELLEHGRRVSRPQRAWIGMFCYALPDRTVVAGLIPGAPGERAGLAVGDIIVRVGDEQVKDRQNLYEQLWKHRPGETIRLRVYRDGRITDLTVETADADDFFAVAAD